MMDTKLIVDVVTGVMEPYGMLDNFSEGFIARFRGKLEQSLKHAAAGAPDLRSAKDEYAEFEKWKGYPQAPLNSEGRFDIDWVHREFVAFKAGLTRAALASAAPVEALTDEEVIDLVKENLNRNTTGECHYWGGLGMMMLFARAIEARIKEGAK